MNNTQRAEGGAVPWWWRPVLAVIGVIIGLAMLSGGAELGTWLVAGEDTTITRVWCDDENEYAFEEGEYISIEHYRDASGAWCQRTTETATESPAGDWPLWLRVPLVILLAALALVGAIGGFGVAILSVYLVCTEEMTDALRDVHADFQAHRNAKAKARAEKAAERNG